MAFLPMLIIVVALIVYVFWFLYKRSKNRQEAKSPEKNGVSKQRTSKVNFCGECGSPLDGKERFCGKCGAEIVNI